MNIVLNGKPHPLEPRASVEDLLKTLGLAKKPVVVEHNKVALFPRDYASIVLEHNDSLEIITIAAGG
jgi:sulfur carrier protein